MKNRRGFQILHTTRKRQRSESYEKAHLQEEWIKIKAVDPWLLEKWDRDEECPIAGRIGDSRDEMHALLTPHTWCSAMKVNSLLYDFTMVMVVAWNVKLPSLKLSYNHNCHFNTRCADMILPHLLLSIHGSWDIPVQWGPWEGSWCVVGGLCSHRDGHRKGEAGWGGVGCHVVHLVLWFHLWIEFSLSFVCHNFSWHS